MKSGALCEMFYKDLGAQQRKASGRENRRLSFIKHSFTCYEFDKMSPNQLSCV